MWSSLETASTAKIRLLGLEVIKDFGNGIRIVKEPNEDGGYRVLGMLIEDIKIDDVIESYGLTEISLRVVDEVNGKPCLVRKFIVINENGEILLDEFDKEYDKEAEKCLLEAVLKHGVDESLFEPHKEDTYFDANYIGYLIHAKEMCSGKYQLVMVSNRDELNDRGSFVLFHKPTKRVITYGFDRPFEFLNNHELNEYITDDNEQNNQYEQDNQSELNNVAVLLGKNEVVAVSLLEGTHATIKLSNYDNTCNDEQVLMGYIPDIVKKLYKETKSMGIEKRYHDYTASKIKEFLHLDTETLRKNGIDVIDNGRARIISVVSDMAYRGLPIDEINAFGNILYKQYKKSSYGTLIVDGMRGKHKAELSDIDYELAVQHKYGLLELINLPDKTYYKGCLLDGSGNILVSNLDGSLESIAKKALDKATTYILKKGYVEETQALVGLRNDGSKMNPDMVRLLNITEHDYRGYKVIIVANGDLDIKQNKVNMIAWNKATGNLTEYHKGIDIIDAFEIVGELKAIE